MAKIYCRHQVDAAINPGNSGGPVFIGNQVVGVAFQGYGGHQGLNYIIPAPIMKHFLIEAFSDNKYRGFPTLPIVTEQIENPNEREFYRMGKRSGIRILKVDNLSDAFSKLKPDDIILAIDGLPISNEGTVDIPDIGNCIDYFHVMQSKFVGDSVRLNILRKKADKDEVEELEIDVVLDTILGDTEKVSVAEHDKMPTYYINSGICFVPLTRNYMEGNGCEFEEMHLVEESCSLPDAPKKNPTDQVIVINTILNCKETQGYEKHIRGIVKEINGKSINNIHDVVRAMEENKENRHVISLASKSKIVIPNMSPQEHAKLLKRNHISQDRSSDLDTMLIEPTPQRRPEIISPIPIRPLSLGLFGQSAPHNEQKATKPKRKRIIESEEEENDEVKSILSGKEEIDLTKDMLPGLKRWQQKIVEMEERYKDLPEDEEDDEDYAHSSDEEYSDEKESESDRSMDLEESETEEDLEVKPKSNSSRKAQHHVFFKPSSMDVETNPEQNHKRFQYK